MSGAPAQVAPPEVTPAVELAGVTKRFGGVVAVADLSFQLRPHTITGLIGPNGAGKTTVLNLITGFLAPTEGSVTIGGTVVTGWRPHRVAANGVARTYQNILLLDRETVATNVLLGCHLALRAGAIRRKGSRRGHKEAMARVDRLLTDLGLTEVADSEVAQLPYGVRRRVEIARALAASPTLLILDEPTAGMTRTESDDIGNLVGQVREAGTTVLLVEHNVRLVREVCDEVLVVEWGRLIARDSARNIWNHAAVRTAYLGDMADAAPAPGETGGGGTC